jgi:hypothetical protein
MTSSFEMLLNSYTREKKTNLIAWMNQKKKVAPCLSHELRLTLHLDSFVQVNSSVLIIGRYCGVTLTTPCIGTVDVADCSHMSASVREK